MKRVLCVLFGLAINAWLSPSAAISQDQHAPAPHEAEGLDRSHLPLPNTLRPGLITYDAKNPDSKFPPIPRTRPPKGAPNVLIVLIDDVGFGASSTFGGPCQTPTLERLAKSGLRYTRFHTTALCSPTRQALLTGRNHHSVGMGGITEIATGAPGYSSVRPNSKAPLAMTLKLNGYSTSHFGKCHEVPVWQTSPAGPFDAWPTGGNGFEYFYGFIGGEANQWYPTLYEGTTPVDVEKTPEEGYHLMPDMTDKAIKWIGQQKSLMPDKPFFMYFAPGATHAPHHVPKEWADKYKGQFDHGYDAIRAETWARQKRLGVIPADAKLTDPNPEVPRWKDVPDEFKPVLARQMEVYAGFLEYTDHHVGRLIKSARGTWGPRWPSCSPQTMAAMSARIPAHRFPPIMAPSATASMARFAAFNYRSPTIQTTTSSNRRTRSARRWGGNDSGSVCCHRGHRDQRGMRSGVGGGSGKKGEVGKAGKADEANTEWARHHRDKNALRLLRHSP